MSLENKDCNLAIIFDSETENSNSKEYKEYKANRVLDYSEFEESPFTHYPIIRKVLNYLEIFNVESKNYEADDYIATLADKYSKKYGVVYIASNDSDFYQLLSNKIKQIKLGRRVNYEVIIPEKIKETLGIKVEEYVYYKSLMGDKTDNIPGIPNIGPKRALRIMQDKYDIDLSLYKELLKRNRKLIKMNKKVPLKLDLKLLTYNKNLLSTSNKSIFAEVGL
jgi:DNA polymerase-1